MTASFVRLSARWGAAALALVFLVPVRPAAAQGVTTAAVAGRITDDAGAPVGSAELILVNTTTGERHSTRTRADGWYSVENVSVGGPYTATARALGFEPKTATGFMVTLGQRLALDLSLKRAAIEVAAVSVEAESNPLTSTSRTGAQTVVSDRAIQRLPTLNRSFTDFMSTAPQIVGRSVTGQNDRFNNIQIDGGSNNDLFNLGSTNGTPGGSVNARPLNIEAVKEYQILIAPFDVRQGGFVGGLVNAVTKSGTNDWHGAAFGYTQNQNFVGKQVADSSVPVAEYQQQQYGFSLGGPIIKDRVHVFVSGDFRHDARPFASSLQLGPSGDTTGTGVGITAARFDSVRNILINQYGFDPGGYAAPIIPNPETNLFAKIGYELGTNSHFELSGAYVNANRFVLGHSYRANYTSASANLRDGYILGNSGYDFTDRTRTVRAKWTSMLGSRYSNELIVGYSTIKDVRELPNRVPLILVGGNSAGSYIAAGAERFSQANSLDQTVVEVSDNVTFMMREHQVTLGTHNEFFHFVNVFFPGSIGIWNFASPDSLANALPNQYFRALPTVQRPDGPLADFRVKQWGFYAQDRFSPIKNLTVTAGLRIDVPSQPAPSTNPILRDSVTFPAIGGTGINTGAFPSGNILWSPRLGFNYDVTGDRSTVLRGGVGIFSGRPPYVWVANAYGNTGQEQQSLYCVGATVPTFTVNPDSQPTSCAAAPTAGRPSIVYFDSDFKFPQAMKLAIGIDQQLGWGMVGTVDFLLTQAVNQFFLQDVNLVGPQGTSSGEAGRVRFGSINAATGASTAARVTARYADVIRNTNASGDRSTSLTAQLQKRFSNGIEFAASYTYGHSLDRISMTSDITGSNYSFSVLDGTPDHRNLRTSFFDRPHKVTLSASLNAPLDTRFSLTYNGLSGTPFTYVVNGDPNADGISGNDPVYVPRNASDITTQNATQTAQIEAFINGEKCLSENRGRILPRNACRNKWQNLLNARISKVVPTLTGHSIEITADMLNVLNFLNSSWGLQRVTGTGFENQNFIRLAGYDAVNQRGIYTPNTPSFPIKDQVTLNALGSRWVFQLGARYTF
jgi:hypothetical protein